MILEHNIEILIDSQLGELEIISSDKYNIYYEFIFYPEILN